MHMADQGDGNHFAFLGTAQWSRAQLEKLKAAGYGDLVAQISTAPQDADGSRTVQALVTHHGSRGLGSALYTRGANAAAKHVAKIGADIPEELAWLDYDTPAGMHYWDALQYVSRWTRANHRAIHQRFLTSVRSREIASFGNEHNFVWKRGETFLHGKGATPAWKDDEGRPLLGLIPMNMASPILIVLGKDNPDYQSFAPHGAGRNQSRRGMLRQFKTKGGGIDKQRIAQMIANHTSGIDVRWFGGKPDFTETPSAYKDATRIREQIEQFELAEIAAEIHPLGCVMAGETSRRDEEEELTPKQKRQIEHRAIAENYANACSTPTAGRTRLSRKWLLWAIAAIAANGANAAIARNTVQKTEDESLPAVSSLQPQVCSLIQPPSSITFPTAQGQT